MKTMNAKYPGRCVRCNGAILRGDVINFHGRGRAEHAHCPAAEAPKDRPCWKCKGPGGRMRNLGAAAPVWCDACLAAFEAKDRFNEPPADNEHDEDARGDEGWQPGHGEDERAGIEPGTLASDRRLAARGLTVVRFAGGGTMTQNSRGRCEDAPCCGCCS